MKDWTIGEALIVAMIVGVVVLVVWVTIDSRDNRADKVAAREATSTTRTHPDVERFIDRDAGVVCWVYRGYKKGGIHCLPLEQTRLRAEGP